MNSELISQIVEICIIPLLAILTRYIVKYIDAKERELQTKIDNQIAQKYTKMIADKVKQCVETTNQTFVDSLKQQGKFDQEAQEQAFKQTLAAVLGILGDDAKEFIKETSGDVSTYLIQVIESTVKNVKNKKAEE